MATLPSQPLPHLAVSLNGSCVGDVRAIEGLQAEADVVSNDLGPNGLTKKHVSNIRWTPGLLTLGLGMGAPMATWLRSSLAQSQLPASGSIVRADANDRAQSSIDFTNAVLTQLTVPALDALSNDPAALLVGFDAEQVRIAKGDGSDSRGNVPAPKPWLCSGFRIALGNLPCDDILRVESLSWTAVAGGDQVGIFREPTKHPMNVTVPDLELTIGAKGFAPWAAAAQRWFIDGEHLEPNEMAGTITLVGDGDLATIMLANVGFKRFPFASPAENGSADRFVVTLYIESLGFELKG
jgi:hypothetical protein